MDLTTITVSDFKALFTRDFAYLPVWAAGLYNQGTEVYYTPTLLFYTALKNGVTSTPDTLGTDWSITPDNVNNFILDSDITRAFAEAQITFNQGLFNSDANITLGYLYLTAHYLVNDIKASLNPFSASGGFPVQSKGAGSLSESYAIPKKFQDNLLLQFYAQSAYGRKYLNMILPNMVGGVSAVYGGTNP